MSCIVTKKEKTCVNLQQINTCFFLCYNLLSAPQCHFKGNICVLGLGLEGCCLGLEGSVLVNITAYGTQWRRNIFNSTMCVTWKLRN